MTIEASSASSVARSAESKGVKNKQGNDADNGGGGFGAVLAAVETPQANPAPNGDRAATNQAQAKNAGGKSQPQSKAKGGASAQEATKADAAVAKDAATAKGVAGVQDDAATADDTSAVAGGAVPVDPAAAALALLQTADTGAEPMDAAALLAQSAAWTAAGSAAAGSGASSANGHSDLQNGQPPATAVAALGNTAGPTGLRPVATPGTVPEGAAQPAVPQSELLSDAMQKALKTAVDAKGKTASQTGATPETALPADGKASALLNQKQADGNATQLATALASAAASVVVPPRREESSRERSVFRANSNDSAVSPQALSTPAPTQTVSGAPEVVPATDAFVAEKVSYWISNNVQNAEMKLDGVGDRPVEVSIRMQGNEAHVAFRTDELQTRAALESASEHLKDLLHREGLVLSGVSVGTAGTGGSGPQDRKSRQGERQATVTTLQPLSGDLRSATNRASRGGLDLFV